MVVTFSFRSHTAHTCKTLAAKNESSSYKPNYYGLCYLFYLVFSIFSGYARVLTPVSYTVVTIYWLKHICVHQISTRWDYKLNRFL